MRTEPNRQEQEKLHNKKNRRILLWVLVLALLILLSSCGLMYHLGKRAQEQAEPNCQTIRVEEEQETETVLSIYGIVSYTDGTPCAGHTIELHSTLQTTQTGADGSFFFYNVERGDHTLAVLDADGREKASLNFNISEHEDKTLQYVNVSAENQRIRFEIPVNTLLLNVDVELDETVHTLTIGGVTAGLTEGRVLTASGSVQAKDGEAVVFASGHYMLQDGTIVLANGGILFAEPSYLPPDAAGDTLPKGVTINENGVIQLPDDSMLNIPDYGDNAYLVREKDSRMVGNNGAGSKNIGIMREDSKQEHGTEYSQASDGPAENRDEDTEKLTESSRADTEDVATDFETGSDSSSDSGNSSGDNSTSETTAPSEESGTVEIGDRKTGKLWKQMAAIDLFASPDGSQIYEKLYPGIEGRYDFYIRNTMKEITYMTVSIWLELT